MNAEAEVMARETIGRVILAETGTPVMRAMTALGGGVEGFLKALWLHLEGGAYVLSGPDYFMMCRPVHASAPDALLADVMCRFNGPNAWYVFIAAGNIKALMRAMPYPLEYIGFRRGERSERVHWRRTYRLRRRILNGRDGKHGRNGSDEASKPNERNLIYG